MSTRNDRPNLQFILHHGAPLPLRWWGWETNTHILERQGWRIMAEEGHNEYDYTHRIRIACRSPDDRMIITGVVSVPLQSFTYEYGNQGFMEGTVLDHYFRRGMEMQVYNATDRIHTYQLSTPEFNSLNALAPIDIYKATAINSRDLHIGRLKCFEYMEDKTNDIFIPPTAVDECLNMILKLQYPQQKEIKKGLIIPGTQPLIQAKVFSLAA